MKSFHNSTNNSISPGNSSFTQLIIDVIPLVMNYIRTEMRNNRMAGLTVPQLRALIVLCQQRNLSRIHSAGLAVLVTVNPLSYVIDAIHGLLITNDLSKLPVDMIVIILSTVLIMYLASWSFKRILNEHNFLVY